LFLVAQRLCHGNDHDRNAEELLSVHIVVRNSFKNVGVGFWTRFVKNDERNATRAITLHGKKADAADPITKRLSGIQVERWLSHPN
jgi:hypothetical protein